MEVYFIKDKIDDIIKSIKIEIGSDNKLVTKVVNYEYWMGRYYALLDIAEKVYPSIYDYYEVMQYRKEEIDKLSHEMQINFVNKVYEAVGE